MEKNKQSTYATYFTRLGSLENLSSDKTLAYLQIETAKVQSLLNNPSAGNAIFVFQKIPYMSIAEQKRAEYNFLFDKYNNFLKVGKEYPVNEVYGVNLDPVAFIPFNDATKAYEMRAWINSMIRTKEIVDDITKNALTLNFTLSNILFSNENHDAFIKEGFGGAETGNIGPFTLGAMMKSCVQTGEDISVQEFIKVIDFAKFVYIAAKDKPFFQSTSKIFGDDYLQKIEETVVFLNKRATIQEKKETLRTNSIQQLEAKLGIKAADIDLKTEIERLGESTVDTCSDVLSRIVLWYLNNQETEVK